MLKLVIVAIVVTLVYAGPQKIVRPCRFNDLKCLRDNFAANSKCSRNVRGSIPDSYVIDTFTFETPYFNSSYIDRALTIRNQNKCYVSEFFFNVKSDTSVITIDCPDLDIQAKRTLVRHQTAVEDEYFHFNYRAIYPLVRLTMNIKHADAMQVCSSYTFADITQLPRFIVDPTDKPTEKFLSTDLSLMDIYERENFSYRAPQLMKQFINSYICDYGCE